MEKTYRSSFLLGRTSDTEDIEGQVVELADAPVPTEEQIREALQKFIGTTWQRPPAFSALKIAGQRAYVLARRGDAVELAPRPVEIHAIEMLRYEYPELELRIRCGSGTYIRSLGRDLARALGTDAIMSALRREAIGPFQANQALSIERLDAESIRQSLQSSAVGLGEMPRIVVNDDEVARLARGQAIRNRFGVATTEIAALDDADNLTAILVHAGGELLRPTKCFVASQASG